MTKNFFVTIFLCDRAYGGPEEGGWWYDCGEREKDRRVFVFHDEVKADHFTYRFNERLNKWVNKHRRPISSVLSEGEYRAICEERQLLDYFPAVRPHYE